MCDIKICPVYTLKRNSNRQKQTILLMISKEERWNYLTVRNISTLLR